MDEKDKDSFPGVDAYMQLIRDEFSSNSQPPVVMWR